MLLALLYFTHDATFALGGNFYIYHFFFVDVLTFVSGASGILHFDMSK